MHSDELYTFWVNKRGNFFSKWVSSPRTQAILPQIILVNADSNYTFYMKYLCMSQSRNIMEYNVFLKEHIFNWLIECFVMFIN